MVTFFFFSDHTITEAIL